MAIGNWFRSVRPVLRAIGRWGQDPAIAPSVMEDPRNAALLATLRSDHPWTWASLRGIHQRPLANTNAAGEFSTRDGTIGLTPEWHLYHPDDQLDILAHEFGHAVSAMSPLRGKGILDRLADGSYFANYKTEPDEIWARSFGHARAFEALDPQQPPLFPWRDTLDAVMATRPEEPVTGRWRAMRDADDPGYDPDEWDPYDDIAVSSDPPWRLEALDQRYARQPFLRNLDLPVEILRAIGVRPVEVGDGFVRTKLSRPSLTQIPFPLDPP